MNWSSPANTALIKAFLALKSAREARSFLRDLLTETELEEFAKRLKTASLLAKKVPYSTIEAETGLSSTTIARVAHWLHRGMGGYRLVLKRLKQ
ncbi:hypothetical protein A3C21_01460 [Candidatus Kaiserbacteria bacterium RIFCSPHIGHO2_02_FULL_59_21]|uniref:TrpR like protein, YerC/YecD n=2 Tax=Candidatus Kaiseribacteriota TaxID=1752734 RepID=A0A0G1YQQ8_9BACT|nr:MAG: hypothetical protein UY98_C0043G0006 [Candidatus Kaiserbacteria bacterium GW2011_GWA2_58_9]OGG62477.1 MAG: hypothetical protein A2766_00710 [Candidatus Kaiserbacteria bacterium RIFCSPHIGHO2_01_FULL_58_22]OGG67537.1 MAG: hypothetical protein A3C21_01460 [Candidatus Kaiserbacteria bacterium RIFCSPHIGHO2_02_FULL_59_21]OGG80141.1 MAG: hypothetical protein A2952_03590 [Candidatus Kaiserbacteria bacterium RIFCSPLOWO2_01_FULL_59_34]OGG86932.1 MAG: hypothetical protein A3I47_02980 [Candidatus K